MISHTEVPGPPWGGVCFRGRELDPISRPPGLGAPISLKGRLDEEISTLPFCAKIPCTVQGSRSGQTHLD